MPKLEKNILSLLTSMDDLCRVMIEEAEESTPKVDRLRIAEMGDLRAMVKTLVKRGHEYPLEEFGAKVERVSQRVREFYESSRS